MNNMNIDENTMKNIKNMVDNGNLSEAMSQISPEMIQNFSKILSNQNNQSAEANNNTQANFSANENSTQNASSSDSNNSGFDFSNIDMNTIMKFSSAFSKMNNSKNDPRANRLNSLKPYLRDEKKGKVDQYMNLLNVSKIAEIMKENNKENNNNV